MYIEIEGIDGSGKTTQCKMLVERLVQSGRRALVVKDLSDATAFGSCIAQVITSGTLRDSRAELFSFLACKAQLYSEIVRPRIENNEWVVGDRGGGSFLTYNLLRLGIGPLELQSLLGIATLNTHPVLTFLLDVPVDAAIVRKRQQRAIPTRFDNMDPEFFTEQRQLFLDMAKKDPSWVIVDGEAEVAAISELIWDRCQPYL